MNRQEHLAWCRKRAMEYVTQGDFQSAVSSMISDLGKNPETSDSVQQLAAMLGIAALQNPTEDSIRKFIEGFN